jgi:hypothetical protein
MTQPAPRRQRGSSRHVVVCHSAGSDLNRIGLSYLGKLEIVLFRAQAKGSARVHLTDLTPASISMGHHNEQGGPELRPFLCRESAPGRVRRGDEQPGGDA